MKKIKFQIVIATSLISGATVFAPITSCASKNINPEPDILKNCISIATQELKCVFKFYVHSSEGNIPNLQYSLDMGKTWNILTPDWEKASQYSATLNVPEQSILMLRGNNPKGWSRHLDEEASLQFSTPVKIIGGNVMSLLDNGTGTIKDIPSICCFQKLFNFSKGIISINDDFLPSMKLTPLCYSRMFEGCESLNNMPDLPATNLAYGCYNSMFNFCPGLREIKNLPATHMEPFCYCNMFSRLHNLQHIDLVLPSTDLADSCYKGMFGFCSNLKETPKNMLPSLKLAPNCYEGMFTECFNLISPPDLPANELTEFCYAKMFEQCVGLKKPPYLPAANLIKGCYNGLFWGCSFLTNIKVGFTAWKENCTKGWVSSWDETFPFSPSGIFECHPQLDTSIVDVDHFPSGWRVAHF